MLLALGRDRQGDPEFWVILSYILSRTILADRLD